ncbi:hypothetical protein QUA56_00985 [Microcoleus sp. N3A4]|uniref:hypothetical protein n=1 Tax=Microcoleus sp. N3A4 TaxID=3055379 RepID=UPI002FD41AB1
MPVPQENLVFQELARCPFHKKMEFFKNWQDARSTRKWSFCGTGILPVAKQAIENDA